MVIYGNRMKNISKNAGIWLVSAIAVTILAAIFIIELEARLGEHSGIFIIAVAYYATCFALAGTVVQGIFIKMHYFQFGAASSILMVGTLTLIIIMILHIYTPLGWGIDLRYMSIVLATPIYTITAISYFSTRDN